MAEDQSASKKHEGNKPDEVPIIGGFFLNKRTIGRVSAVGATVILAIISKMNIGVPLSLLVDLKSTIYLFSFASWFGCAMWVNLVAGLVMFKNLPRHVFGRLQAALFPRFFQYSAVFVGICIVVASLSPEPMVPHVQFVNLVVILIIIVINLSVLEPKTTSLMYERHKVERRLGTGHEIGIMKPKDPKVANDPELRALTKRFGKLHGMSASLSLLSLCLSTWHISWLASTMTFQAN